LNNSIPFFAGKEPKRNTVISATTWGYLIEANDKTTQSNFSLYPSLARYSPETIDTDEFTVLNIDASCQACSLPGDTLQSRAQAGEMPLSIYPTIH
jgi:hypothetical protein